MKSVAIIPLRAGSKSIIGKNKKKLLGRALYQWILGEAIFSELDEIYIFTDDDEILFQVKSEYNWTPKVIPFKRSIESAIDTASTEMAMLELAENIDYNFDIYMLLQATSPLTNRNDINAILDKVKNKNFDSALTVVESKRFTWNIHGQNINYDYLNRPRRQDFEGMLIENGAVYASTKENFIKNKNRIGGEIGIVKMEEDTLSEIDEPNDWVIVSELLKSRIQKNKGIPEYIKYIVLDVDGVFTNGTVAVGQEGELFKSFSLRDGMGLELLRNNGIEPVVMTSENSSIVAKRMEKLQIKHCFLGTKDKFSRLDHFCNKNNVKRENVAYLGDDINDLSNIYSVGWSFVPNDGIREVKLAADIVLNNRGGDKAIREVSNFLISYNRRKTNLK